MSMGDKMRIGLVIEEMAETIVRLRKELDDMSMENNDLTLELSSPKRAETIEKLSRSNERLKKRLSECRKANLRLIRQVGGAAAVRGRLDELEKDVHDMCDLLRAEIPEDFPEVDRNDPVKMLRSVLSEERQLRRPRRDYVRTEFSTVVSCDQGIVRVDVGRLNCCLLGFEIDNPEVEILDVCMDDAKVTAFPVRTFGENISLWLKVAGEAGNRRISGAYWCKP